MFDIRQEQRQDYAAVRRVVDEAFLPAEAGYVPASRYGISAPFAVPDENFMAICFDPAAGVLDGRMAYDEAFGIGASGQAAHKKGENGYGNQKG